VGAVVDLALLIGGNDFVQGQLRLLALVALALGMHVHHPRDLNDRFRWGFAVNDDGAAAPLAAYLHDLAGHYVVGDGVLGLARLAADFHGCSCVLLRHYEGTRKRVS
jgi:hypothetical protein